MDENCFICEKTLKDGAVVLVSRGMKTLQTASKDRDDGKFEYLCALTKVTVHVECRKSYTHRTAIEKVKKTRELEAAGLAGPSSISPVQAKIRPSEPTFNFKDFCLICGKEASHEHETAKHLKYRNPIRKVSTLSMKSSILEMADKRNNDSWAKEVRKRIINEIDLVASEIRYHAHCFSDFFKPPSNENRGRPLNPKVSSAMEEIFSYIEHNNDCQFTITELKNILTDYVPDDKTITRKLLERYGDRISIVSKTTGPSIICFLDTQYDILNDTWYTDRKNQNTEERLRVVATAAAIIRRDIREQICDTKFYPPSDKILDRNYSFIPKSLMLFLEELIVRNKKGKIEPLLTKCMGIAHSIVSAIKSRSFLSPLLIGIAVVLHRRFGSKRILDILSSLGFSASYKEAQLYEASALFHPQPQIPVGSFVQYVFDNADFNVGTIDGLNTFHSMGGIEIVTPAGAIPADTPMMRRQAMPTAAEIRAIGHVPVLVYEGSSEAALSKIQVESVADREAGIISESSIHQCDLLWMWAKWQKIPKIPGSNGFMEAITQNKSVEKSKIICLPFVNEPPSNYNTIYTSLNVALDRARNLEQKTCIVTFDQPLYAKAREIVAASGDGSEVSRIIVRLGGFHLMMSFLGSIGYIMAGSGLKEIFSTIYAPISADKMLTGHAYARAMRGHILVQLALVKLILEEITVDAEDCDSIGCILESFEENPPSFELIENAAEIRKLKEKFDEKILELKNRGATSKLWIQYIQMVAIAKEFLRAERTSDWRMHLASIRKMLPYFHAAGHFPYAKSAHLYLQDMQKLEETMDMDEFKKFTDQGFFAVRRTSKQWGGNWTGMTIEQSLMKSMKVTGGITHGRGTTESVLSRWILGMPAAHNISEEIEKLCGISFDNVDQHVDTRDSRIKRDESDSDKLLQWLSSHQPFPDIERIMSIATGVVGSDKINCQNAQEIGRVVKCNGW